MSDWYENPTVTAERAVLTSSIVFKTPENISAQFLIPIFTPTQDNSSGSARNVQMRAPSTKSQSGNKLAVTNYTTSNNITLTIPKYMVYQFYEPDEEESTIPKGTEFIITGIGQKDKIEEMRIIGLYKY